MGTVAAKPCGDVTGGVGMGCGEGVGLAVGVGEGVQVGTRVPVAVGRGVWVGVDVGLAVGEGVMVGVGVNVGSGLGVGVGVPRKNAKISAAPGKLADAPVSPVVAALGAVTAPKPNCTATIKIKIGAMYQYRPKTFKIIIEILLLLYSVEFET